LDSFVAAPFDFDEDGDVDVYVVNLGGPNLLHRNDGRGVFVQVADEVGLAHQGRDLAAFPADYDNDGDLDLYVINTSGEANALYRNDGPTGFVDRADAGGVAGSDNSVGAAWADFDNDGDVDLLVSNVGVPRVYENEGEGSFRDIAATALGGIASEDLSTTGITLGDYDLDGDVDAFVGANQMPDLLLRNDSDGGNGVRIEWQSTADRTCIGGRIQAYTGDVVQRRQITAAVSLGSTQGTGTHIGLGEAEALDSLVVEWPSGQRQIVRDIVAGTVLRPVEPAVEDDLRLVWVLTPALGQQWGRMMPEAQVRNDGSTVQEGASLELQVLRDGQTEYRQSVEVGPLLPGASVRLRLPQWEPVSGGAYRFIFTVSAADQEDQVPANNRWERLHHFYEFKDLAPQLGVDDAGFGWAGALGDYDNDGDLDLYVSNGGSLGEGRNVLLRNDGASGFTDVTQESGSGDSGNGTGVVFADFNRDGWQDLYIAKGGFLPPGQSNRLFENQRDGRFQDISAAVGLERTRASYATEVGDYDRDGFLDLYVTQFRGQSNTLFRNNTQGGFEDLSRAKDILNLRDASGAAGVFTDFTGDGKVELYASFFGGFDVLYTDLDNEPAMNFRVGDQGEAVGVALGDYDSDGDLDLYVVNQDGRSGLRENSIDEGEGIFSIGAESGTENKRFGTGVAFGDYDSDGALYLFVSNAEGASRVYRQVAPGRFLDQAPVLGMADSSRSRAVLLGDYDNDGDLDVFVINEGSENRLYTNGGGSNHWIQVGVRGVESNTDGIGARLRLFTDGQLQHREVNGTVGLSFGTRISHFGLGSVETVDSLQVRWSSGLAEVFKDPPVDSRFALVEEVRLTAVEAAGPEPDALHLGQNYPNPFNAATTIEFNLEQTGPTRLAVYNILGQLVRDLANGELDAGLHRLVWNGLDKEDREMSSGVYFYRLQSGGEERLQSLVLLR
jgi:hypothetical protein